MTFTPAAARFQGCPACGSSFHNSGIMFLYSPIKTIYLSLAMIMHASMLLCMHSEIQASNILSLCKRYSLLVKAGRPCCVDNRSSIVIHVTEE